MGPNLFLEFRLIHDTDNVSRPFQCFCVNTASDGWRAELGHRPMHGYSALPGELCGDFVRILLRCDVLRGYETDPKLVDWHRAMFGEYLLDRTLHGGSQFI